MYTFVHCDIEQLEGTLHEFAGRFLAHECEDTAVVVAVGVDVEKVSGDGCGKFIHEALVGALTDIDHALEHPCYLARNWAVDERDARGVAVCGAKCPDTVNP